MREKWGKRKHKRACNKHVNQVVFSSRHNYINHVTSNQSQTRVSAYIMWGGAWQETATKHHVWYLVHLVNTGSLLRGTQQLVLLWDFWPMREQLVTTWCLFTSVTSGPKTKRQQLFLCSVSERSHRSEWCCWNQGAADSLICPQRCSDHFTHALFVSLIRVCLPSGHCVRPPARLLRRQVLQVHEQHGVQEELLWVCSHHTLPYIVTASSRTHCQMSGLC